MFSFLWHGCPTIKQIINQTAKMSCKTMFTQYNPANEVGSTSVGLESLNPLCYKQSYWP